MPCGVEAAMRPWSGALAATMKVKNAENSIEERLKFVNLCDSPSRPCCCRSRRCRCCPVALVIAADHGLAAVVCACLFMRCHCCLDHWKLVVLTGEVLSLVCNDCMCRHEGKVGACGQEAGLGRAAC